MGAGPGDGLSLSIEVPSEARKERPHVDHREVGGGNQKGTGGVLS